MVGRLAFKRSIKIWQTYINASSARVGHWVGIFRVPETALKLIESAFFIVSKGKIQGKASSEAGLRDLDLSHTVL